MPSPITESRSHDAVDRLTRMIEPVYRSRPDFPGSFQAALAGVRGYAHTLKDASTAATIATAELQGLVSAMSEFIDAEFMTDAVRFFGSRS